MQLAYALDTSRIAAFSETAAAARSAGFNSIEIAQATPDALAPLAGSTGVIGSNAIPIACIATSAGYSTNTSAAAGAADGISALIDRAAALACPVVAIEETVPAQSGDPLELIAQRAAWLTPLASHAQRRGVTLAYTNNATLAVAADLWRLLETVSAPALGICWHPPRALQVGGPASARAVAQSAGVVVPTLNTRIKHVRFDWPTDVKPHSPLQLLTQRLAGIGYRGAVAIKGLDADMPQAQLADIVKSLRGVIAP